MTSFETTGNPYRDAHRRALLAAATVIVPDGASLQEGVEALAAAGYTPEQAIDGAFAVKAIQERQPADPFEGLA